MRFAVENYVSQINAATNRFNRLIWSVATLLAFCWLGLIAAAPLLKTNDAAAANGVYTFFSYLCHQEALRSFYLYGEPLAVCARCSGVYFGLVFGMLIYRFVRDLRTVEPVPRVWLMLAPVPTTLDFLLGVIGVWENTHLSRFLTATILGVGCAFFLVPGLLEISRYFWVSGKQ